ncbi:Lrp/AsnC family transcriptional regulator [Rhodanobacter sp. AS-Z3]|uniref:Lrp/AsnC family transcriptional regulator n=1 Tax=Rhodanobacter sp. AS-Z3 TaxID=3031330 RepID=UPI00247AABE2|nr:Lrp/AsnC family transcriptional regulator [Rhodanobacter sp. AS-Z3]WEN15711.1 Lrp/AsnC family transcriptional regulator [Rhodanobacter sp. AS-Z3]
MLDDIDLALLRALQAEPELSIQQLAERINLSHTPCWRRLKRLESSGVIRGRAVLLDAAALDLPITVFAEVKLKQHDEDTLSRLEDAVASCPPIVECFSMSGDRDYIFRIVMQSVAQYEQFLKKTLLHLPGVASISSSFALKCVKLTTSLPI